MKSLEEKQDDLRQAKWLVGVYAVYVIISLYGAIRSDFDSTPGAEIVVDNIRGMRGIYQFNLEQCSVKFPREYQTFLECKVE